ncbi:MAG TPA: hypothetical protein DEQ64_14515 [Lachnoclostridium sp.]|jgi:hypothetical protein|uniref:hypothetical protein n=1 Tax=Lacrimispora sp. TaxID=2719234 RepID=UPI000EDDB75F|nr:hypothetical protein [Lacrimispora sp.]HCD44913.1 hypothetical protein [Lachnoclostridium sp.]
MENKIQMAYLPLKEYAEGKAALSRIETMKECLLRGDYVQTSKKIADILGCDSERPQNSYLPVKEYTEGKIALLKIQILKDLAIESSYGVTDETIAGILGIELPVKEKPDEQQ